ncbi:hypothetical protein [Prochlorococcus marinus]|uniref:hypothetical protein n=1 Tax=Prochlorococcus marinus TaxID=1219 RepID=UPI0022B4119A|nr:hypothetical protein [Prochlorococcus marinus]
MNISRLVEKIFIRSFLIVTLFPLQSCSNTLIGEKLENSFDTTENSTTIVKANNKPQKLNEKTKIKLRIKDDKKENQNDFAKITKDNSISNKDRVSQKPTTSLKKTIFNPQPYRIILRLSGANPSAPAETVTEALRKAGVQFEVEKIERFDEKNFSNNTSLKRK